MGLLFIGGGVVGIVVAAGTSVEPTYVFAVGLIIVGAALVITTWLGRGYILIPVGVLLVGLMSATWFSPLQLNHDFSRLAKDFAGTGLGPVPKSFRLGEFV